MTTLKEYAARVEARLDQLLPGGGPIAVSYTHLTLPTT